MGQNFFDLLNSVFKLMLENKLKKDIDDTLFQKLLTFIKQCRLRPSGVNGDVVVFNHKDPQNICFDFIKELINRTEALYLIEKVISSVVSRNENYAVAIRSFIIRFLGLIFENPERIFPYENLLPLLKNTNDEVITDHIPSIQDALLVCLSCITKQFEGALWFIDQNLKDFVFSSFNSSSYYVRKSAANFYINFISHWTSFETSHREQKKLKEEIHLEYFIRSLISYIIDHIHFYRNSREIVFSECCIFILNQLIELKNCEVIVGDHLNLAKNISECFMNLSDEKEFNNKLTDLFLAIHLKFALSDEIVNHAIKYLIMKEDMKLAIDLASSFLSIVWSKQRCSDEVEFFLLPLHILMNIPLSSCESFFEVKSDFIYNIMLRKMENKLECKILVSSSFSALQKVVPYINSDLQRNVGMEVIRLAKCSDYPHHKWLYSVLEDRTVHYSLIEFYSSLLSEEVYPSMKNERSDLIFQSIVEFLKKQTLDSNFLSQLLLLMENVFILHKKYEISLEETERNDFIPILCRLLHDNRESVVDSAIHTAGQIIKDTAWQGRLSEQGIHSIIWDIAIHGNHDGTIRSTALKVVIESCFEERCLNEMKSLKGVTEADIAKILYDLTYDSDFFLQREALSCLFHWVKSKWNELQPSCKDYLYASLVSAIKSLDLELKLTSLDVWHWLLENKFTYSAISSSLDINEYIECFVNSGFGLSMIQALEDYDQAVQYKAASILCKLKQILISNGNSFESLKLIAYVDSKPKKENVPGNAFITVSKEEKDKGINTVMELSTTEQITNISRPSTSSELYDFKKEYFSNDSKDRMCSVSSFWTCLWSENVVSILQPDKTIADISDCESVLNDIISAKVMDYDFIDDTPDCY